MTSVCEAAFPSSTNLYPHIRMALLLANLMSVQDKIEDGIGKTLDKTDVEKLRSKKDSVRHMVDDLESCLAHAFSVTERLQKERLIDEVTAIKILGCYIVRAILFAVKKGKQGYELSCRPCGGVHIRHERCTLL